jgi:membrane protein DedA with SNARE-associated domain
MIALDTLVGIVQAHPFLFLFPLAIVEGPIVTVVAAWLLRGNPWDLAAVFAICVIADLVGDAGLYALGRRAHALSPRWQRRLGLTESRLDRLRDHFRDRGPATLAVGKLTHSAGMAVLLAAGASRMPFGPFVGWNLVATLPKVTGLMALGVAFGAAYGAIDVWIFRISLIMLAIAIVVGGGWMLSTGRGLSCLRR